MKPLLTRHRLARLGTYATTQLAVQVIGFAAGIVLVRQLEAAQYGYYTLAISLVGLGNVLMELGLPAAVLAIGGGLVQRGAALGGLVADAQALQRWLALAGIVAAGPAFVLLMLHQQAAAWQAMALVVLGCLTAVVNVRASIVLAVARLRGHLGFQQRLDLGVNVAKLVLLLIAARLVLDATVACVLNLAATLASFAWLRGYLRQQTGPLQAPSGEHRRALAGLVRRHAPNSVYYVLSSQMTVWLVSLFGSAERVAEVGALGRLGVGFAVIGSVVAAIVQPYFARQTGAAELRSGFVAVNAFFASLVLVLATLALAFPREILWMLGARYAGLHTELLWVVLATSTTSWSYSVYHIGCARGWVLPSSLMIGSGVLATVLGIRWFDMASVAGVFQMNTFVAVVGALVGAAYVGTQIGRYGRVGVVATA